MNGTSFRDQFNNVLGTINGYIWHDIVLYIVMGVGILFTIWSGFCQYRALTHGVAVTRGKYDDKDDPGWWDIAVGPGKCIDTDRYFVICANVLGGCRGTTGPNSLNPATGAPYGADFPTTTIGDMVTVQRRLIDQPLMRAVLADLALDWEGALAAGAGGGVGLAGSATGDKGE